MDLTPGTIEKGGMALVIAVLLVVVGVLWRENRALWDRHVGKAETMATKATEIGEALRSLTERIERLEELQGALLAAIDRRVRRGGGG